jgi:hypothetical protein
MASRRLFDGAQKEIGSLPIVGIVAAVTKIWIKISGVWKESTPYLKVSGVWKAITPYIKVSGVWK